MLLFARALLFLTCLLAMAALGATLMFIGVMVLGALTGADNMNGGLAMGAAGLMPVGAALGLAFGTWLGWRAVTRLDPATIQKLGFGILAAIAVAAGGWALTRQLSDGNPYAMGSEPEVLIEWRLPETVPHAMIDRIYRHRLRSSYKDWILPTGWAEPAARDENGQTILRWSAQIRWRVTGRVFEFWTFPNHDARVFVDLGLPRKPEPGPFTDWQDVPDLPGHTVRTRVLSAP